MTNEIKKHTFKPGLPQEFEIIDLQQLFREFKDEMTSPHRTGFYHILWFKKGNPIHLVDFNLVEIQPNSILFLNKNVVQSFDKKGEFEGKVILFTDSFFCKLETDKRYLSNNILFNDLFSVSQIYLQETNTLFEDLFRLMEVELENENDISQAEVLKNLLHSFLLLAERKKRKQNFTKVKKGANLDYIIHFKNLLEANYRELKLVGEYASKLSITPKRLNQATSKVLGKSPKEMINERVILEAKRLLAHTNKSVKEIGFSLGFDEPTNFIKYFRKHSNSTPVEFREQLVLA